jgi:O-antigen biosynthesis protein
MIQSLADLVASARYATDKTPGYLALYDELFAPFRNRDIRLLELGVKQGGSLELWRDYFPQGLIVGLVSRRPASGLDGGWRE